jgi:hypothetical protein
VGWADEVKQSTRNRRGNQEFPSCPFGPAPHLAVISPLTPIQLAPGRVIAVVLDSSPKFDYDNQDEREREHEESTR